MSTNNNRYTYPDHDHARGHMVYGNDDYRGYQGYQGEESYAQHQQYYGGEEQYDPERHFYEQSRDFENPQQDQDYYEETSGYERHTEDESSYFEATRGFNIDGGRFSSVQGSVYYEDGSSVSPTYEHPTPRPPNPRKMSYFKGASGFRITDGDFMSVGGNVYGLTPPQPHSQQRGAPSPRSGTRGGRRGYYTPPPHGSPSPRPTNNPNGMFEQGTGPPYQAYSSPGHRNERGGSHSLGAGYAPHETPNPTQRATGRGRVRGGMGTRGRPPVHSPSRHYQDDFEYYNTAQPQAEQQNPSIHVVSPTQSPPAHQIPTSVQQDPNTEILTTKMHSVTAQMGGLSIRASTERSQALYMKHSDSSTSILPSPNSAVAVTPAPANPYPSPRSSIRVSLETINDATSSSTRMSHKQTQAPEPSTASTLAINSGNAQAHGAEKKSKTKEFTEFLRRKGKTPENK